MNAKISMVLMLFSILSVFAIIAIPALALTPQAFYQGDLFVSLLEKNQFNAGETLNLEIKAFNRSETAIAEGYVVVELVQGSEKAPERTQYYDLENIFLEDKIEGINLRAGEFKELKHAIQLSKNLKQGSYRIDAYFKTEKTPVKGIPHIFSNPASTAFTVKATAGNSFPEASIVRSKTEFTGFTGPVGGPVNAGETIPGKITVKNNSSKNLSGLKAIASLCHWDDTACKEFSSTAVEQFSLKPLEEKELQLSLKAPLMPSAFAIRLELRDENNLLSLYRSRAIVTGGTAIVRKISANKPEFNKGEKASLELIIGASPDHYNNPDFENFNVNFWVENKQGVKLFEKNEIIEKITVAEAFIKKQYSFTALESIDFFKLCGEISKNRTKHDSYCTIIDASKFSTRPDYNVNVSASITGSNLSIEFCSQPQSILLNAHFALMEDESGSVVETGVLKGNSCISKTIKINANLNHSLRLTDFRLGKQYSIPIKAISEMPPAELAGKCGNSVLDAGETCENCSEDIESIRGKGFCAGIQLFPSGIDLLTVLGVLIAIILIAIAIALIIGSGREFYENKGL